MTLAEMLVRLKEVDAACAVCNRCGMCQSVCPVFLQTRHEGDVARGKLALLSGLNRELLTRPDRVLDRLNRCLLCGACERSCSRKVPLTDIFIHARIIINEYTGLSPLKKWIFRVLLARPGLFDTCFRYLAKIQGLFVKPSPGDGTIRITRFHGGRHIRPIPEKSFRSSQNSRPQQDLQMQRQRRVLFFTGCLIDKVMPQVGHACLRVLDACNIAVHFIDDEVCCGIPALAAGDSSAFHSLVTHNLDRVSELEYDTLVTACATCTSTLKTLWPMMDTKTDEHRSEKIRTLAARTMDITEFIMTEGGLQVIMPPPAVHEHRVPVVWHDPCHLKGNGQALALARRMLASLPGYTLVNAPGAGLCCGSGGSFNLEHYDLSLGIGQTKVRHILSSGAAQVITACPGCMLQLTDLLAREGADIRVRHIMELVAESLAPGSDGKLNVLDGL